MTEAIYVLSASSGLLTAGLVLWLSVRVSALESSVSKDELPDI